MRLYLDAPRYPKNRGFPFLFGGTFIEALIVELFEFFGFVAFPSFSEGLSLRRPEVHKSQSVEPFPSFSEGLSLRHFGFGIFGAGVVTFPSFSEGLSLRLGESFERVDL